MRIRARLILLALAFSLLLVVGRAVTGDFGFVLTQFWFTSGFLLLLLLSLVDQPYFSKDANIFVNGVTAWVSLLLVGPATRGGMWWGLFAGATYLVVSSYALMWLRTQPLSRESAGLHLVARFNRTIGRPDALFSAFFLWGAVIQFGASSKSASGLFLFWAIFMILKVPSIAEAVDAVFSEARAGRISAGVLRGLTSPRVAEIEFASVPWADLVGRTGTLRNAKGEMIAQGVVIDDRVLAGTRSGRLAITSVVGSWSDLAATAGVTVELDDVGAWEPATAVSVVDSGSDVGRLIFHVPPAATFRVGEVVRTLQASGDHSFYQVVSGVVCQVSADESNVIQTVRVTAGQLGAWTSEASEFRPVDWVAPAGEIVERLGKVAIKSQVPAGCAVVGCVPHSTFPVHVTIDDVVTHNTAVIGVTGSGKSYLAFHLIEAMVSAGIKVLILDISRQHDLHLAQHNPTALKASSDVPTWIAGESLVGIHQFAGSNGRFPKDTADFVEAAFKELAKAKLERGKNIPAKLCVVFEEAHSLVPEWNQVAQRDDPAEVNRTARAILQGRKYGMGALVISQRTANVTKTILNQCNTIFALQSFDQTGLDFLKNYMGEEYSHAISTLPERHAVLVGKASSSPRPLIVKIENMASRWTGDSAAVVANLAVACPEQAKEGAAPPAEGAEGSER